MAESLIRVLVVDDYGPWRRYIRSTLKEQPELQIIGEASDGLEAVQIAQELQPEEYRVMSVIESHVNHSEGARVRRTRWINQKQRMATSLPEMAACCPQQYESRAPIRKRNQTSINSLPRQWQGPQS